MRLTRVDAHVSCLPRKAQLDHAAAHLRLVHLESLGLGLLLIVARCTDFCESGVDQRRGTLWRSDDGRTVDHRCRWHVQRRVHTQRRLPFF